MKKTSQPQAVRKADIIAKVQQHAMYVAGLKSDTTYVPMEQFTGVKSCKGQGKFVRSIKPASVLARELDSKGNATTGIVTLYETKVTAKDAGNHTFSKLVGLAKN